MEFSNFEKFKTLMNEISMENAGEKALEILQTMGYLAPDCIPKGMFLCLFTNSDELNIAVKLLQRYSLIQFREEKDISIKKDTQTNIRNYQKDMKVDELYLKHAIKLVKSSLKNSSDMSHAISVFAFTKEHPKLIEESILLAEYIVKELILQLRFSEAYLFGKKAVAIFGNTRAEIHSAVIKLEFLVGVSLSLQNRHSEALEFLISLYKKESKFKGKREINYILDAIARTMMRMEFSLSLTVNNDAHLRKIVFGNLPIGKTKDNSVLEVWIDYAMFLLFEFHSPSKALQILRDVVKRRKEILDPDSDDICEAMDHLALALGATNQFNEAFDMFQKVYDKRKKCLGEMNEKALKTKLYIGRTFEQLGDYYTALNIFKDLADKCEQSLGQRNRYTLAVKFNLGGILFHLGEYEEAYKINKDLYQIYIAVSSKINRESCVCKNNMGDILVKQKKFELALEIFQELWEEYKEVYEPYEDKVTKLKIKINRLQQLEGIKSKPETIYSVSMAGNLEKVTAFIQTGININNKDEYGKTPLHYAVEFGHVEIAKMLLKTGAKYNVNNEAGATPLDFAKSFEMRKLLLAIKGLFEDSKTGVDDKVLQHISEDSCIVNVKDKNGYTALHWTAQGGHKSIVKLLLEVGADATLVSDKFNSPLHIAASKGHTEIVELLLQTVGRDKLHEFINGKTETGGNSPLHVAAERGYIDAVRILLSYGAVCDIRNKQGNTPLELSKEWNCCNLLKLIEGLFRDAKKGSDEIISKLCDIESSDLPAIAKARDIEKRTLLQVVIDAKHTGLARKLIRVLKYNDKN